MKLRLMADAPKDGTPIVVCYEITDEGDFLQTVWWTVDGDKGWWDDTQANEWVESELKGWLGTADEIYRALTA